MKIACTFTLFIISFVSLAQTSTRIGGLEKKGDHEFYYFRYKNSLELYKKAAAAEPANDRVKLKIAESYRMLNDPANSEQWYAQVIDNANLIKKEHILHYAQALSSNQKYEEARIWYGQLHRINDGDARPETKVEGINQLDILFDDSAHVEIKRMDALNSPYHDFSPYFYKSGIVFVSERNSIAKKTKPTGGSLEFLDLFYSMKSEDGSHTSPVLFHNNVNSTLHEGPTIFYDGENKMLFTRNNFHNNVKGKSKEGVTYLNIYQSSKKDSVNWSTPVPLSLNNSEYSTGHPALTADGKQLFFISDRPGGIGGTDIYTSRLVNGQWTTPQNLGRPINTEGNEMFPFIFRDNILYFASDGHAGLGGLDIYRYDLSTKSGAVTNLGYPVNSPRDDFGIILDADGDSGYFSSNRKDGKGGDDIYQMRVIKRKINVTLIDSLTRKPIANALVKVIDQGTQSTENKTNDAGKTSIFTNLSSKSIIEIESQEYGSVSVQLQAANFSDIHADLTLSMLKKKPVSNQINLKNKSVTTSQTLISADKTNSNFHTELPNIVVVEGNPSKLYYSKNNNLVAITDSLLSTLTVPAGASPEQYPKYINQEFKKSGQVTGTIMVIRNIYFDYSKSSIRYEASIELDKIADVLNTFPQTSILIQAHTDNRSSESYNEKLSMRRALSAKDYLVKNNIDPNRITIEYFGKQQLVNDCGDLKDCSEIEHQNNRRVEFTLQLRILPSDVALQSK